MFFVKQPSSLKVEEICLASKNNGVQRHGKLLPNTIRCIICGPSNSGKTNLLIGLLLHPEGLHFLNVYIYSKTLYQPKYIYLEHVLKLVPRAHLSKFHEHDDVLSPQQAKSNSVVIFDDVACEKQDHIRDYFAMGRHKNIDCFYLNQTYSKVPKQLIRDNANLMILFKQDDINLKHVYDEHVNTDLAWKQFRDMCAKIWSVPYNFLVINKDCQKNEGRYRQNFDTYVKFY